MKPADIIFKTHYLTIHPGPCNYDDAGNHYSKGLRNVAQGMIAFPSHIDLMIVLLLKV